LIHPNLESNKHEKKKKKKQKKKKKKKLTSRETKQLLASLFITYYR